MTSTMSKEGDQLLCAAENKANKSNVMENGREGSQLEDQKEEQASGKDNKDIKPKKDNPKNKDKKRRPPFRRKAKKPGQTSNVLNLNNEVVKMRHEMRRVRVLVIRKLVRRMAELRKMKGKEEEVKQNERRAARLLEEIHAMKTLKPDVVTKTALLKDLNFDAVCRDPQSTMTDRALARLATHPQFKKRIDEINAAVEAFKVDRMKHLSTGERGEKAQKDNRTTQSPDSINHGKGELGQEEEVAAVEQEESAGKNDEPKKCIVVPKTPNPEKKLQRPPADVTGNHKTLEAPISKPKSSKAKMPAKAPAKAPETEPALKQNPDTLLTDAAGEQESDLSDNEEKEYFDDSTEERFLRQSSLSECSDSGDDFFVGKVSKFKKKKKTPESCDGKQKAKQDSSNKSGVIESELHELESRLKSKPSKLQSVFCSSLSRSKPSRGRVKGGADVRGGGPVVKKEIQREAKVYEKQSKPEVARSFRSTAGVRGTGRGAFPPKGRGGVVSHVASKPTLHPSWEASKRRKEQQGQIQAFQGKKIKFDDSD
ncbi:serum response factor-binding protein 1 [Synchiropus splendidus]|uniref:serum response factor-binding protein 1 n=1 Tax=Synchiropus splendidus TaxID=270530 RepID=UPI00237D38E6|nr:serum response factor-binding protein 1 [Synchiropus splendidus]